VEHTEVWEDTGDDRGQASGRNLVAGHQGLIGTDVTVDCSTDEVFSRAPSTAREALRFP
jgi:hypothetical protein